MKTIHKSGVKEAHVCCWLHGKQCRNSHWSWICAQKGNFFPKITFNKHTYRDSQVLNIYGIQLFLPRTKEKTNAAAVRIGSRQSMPAYAQLIPLFKATVWHKYSQYRFASLLLHLPARRWPSAILRYQAHLGKDMFMLAKSFISLILNEDNFSGFNSLGKRSISLRAYFKFKIWNSLCAWDFHM